MPAASSTRSLVVENMRLLLADCASFRSWVGAADQAAALAKIFVRGDIDVLSRPFAVVGPNGVDERERVAGGTRNVFMARGEVLVHFESDVASGDAGSHEAAFYAFENVIGAIVDEIQLLSGSDGYLNLEGFRQVEEPKRSKWVDDEAGAAEDFYFEQCVGSWSGVGA